MCDCRAHHERRLTKQLRRRLACQHEHPRQRCERRCLRTLVSWEAGQAEECCLETAVFHGYLGSYLTACRQETAE